MSMESAKAFIERMNTDSEFAKRAMEQRGKEQIAAFLKAEGYEFLEEEYEAVSQALGSEELSDEQLDAVAGGRLFCVCNQRLVDTLHGKWCS